MCRPFFLRRFRLLNWIDFAAESEVMAILAVSRNLAKCLQTSVSTDLSESLPIYDRGYCQSVAEWNTRRICTSSDITR
jgi:hypothetical protein